MGHPGPEEKTPSGDGFTRSRRLTHSVHSGGPQGPDGIPMTQATQPAFRQMRLISLWGTHKTISFSTGENTPSPFDSLVSRTEIDSHSVDQPFSELCLGEVPRCDECIWPCRALADQRNPGP